jgi:hypothetical protein
MNKCTFSYNTKYIRRLKKQILLIFDQPPNKKFPLLNSGENSEELAKFRRISQRKILIRRLIKNKQNLLF